MVCIKFVRTLFLTLGVGALLSCTGVPEGVEVVRDFEASRYLGKWYEIARLDHSFERGLQGVTAEYSEREDGGIDVVNSGYNVEEDKRESAEGKAYFIDDRDLGRLKVSFFGPFYGAYNVIELDEDYQWAMVCGPDRDYLWILARSPNLDKAIVDRLIQKAADLGFASDELIMVRHETPL